MPDDLSWEQEQQLLEQFIKEDINDLIDEFCDDSEIAEAFKEHFGDI